MISGERPIFKVAFIFQVVFLFEVVFIFEVIKGGGTNITSNIEPYIEDKLDELDKLETLLWSSPLQQV